MALKIVGCLLMSIMRRRYVTITAVCVHVQVSDNRGTLCDAENSWLPVDVDNRKRCVTIPEVCMHVHMSDNRETMSKAENCWLPVDVDNKEILCDDKRGLRAFSRER